MATEAVPLPGAARRRRFTATPYLFLLPALLSMALLTFYPIVYTVNLAFTNFNLYHFNSYQYIGLKNFQDFLGSSTSYAQVFPSVLIWTLFFAVVTSVVNYVVGFLIAVLLNNPRIPERAIYRTIMIVPYALPSAITVLIWRGLLDQSFGVIDSLLTSVGLPSVPWLADPSAARAAILLVNLWLGFPFNMIVCLGGLQSIPSDIYEAAALDGTSAFDRLRLLTLPLVFRVTAPLLVGAFAFNLTNFNVAYLLTKGLPPRSDGISLAGTTDVLASFSYQLVNTYNQYGKAGAMGIAIFVISAGLSFVGLKFSGAFKEVRV